MKLFLYLVFILVSSINIFIKAQPSIRYEDKIRIGEAYRIAELYGNKIWGNWHKAPFAMLLVYGDNEFLINHPFPSDDFKLIGFDSLLNTKVYYRKRVFNANLLATFPAVNGLSTIVVGTPENTGKSSVEWIITILHEHFHQLQYSQPDYYSSVNTLDLAGEDSSGMWMLNYPFPYEDEKVNNQYKKLTETLLKVVIPFPPDSRLFSRDLISYLNERNIFKNLLNEKDYKYFSFQLWQEGIARYTEYKIADMISHYDPSEELTALIDYKPFYEVADELRENIFNQLKEYQLKDNKRICFYSYGAAEGLLLDRVNKNWKEQYHKEKFFLEKYYPD
ncbi:MAG: hypothetical protein A2V93_05460 [Ignavibacteria bacterium RBG_16_34_14]|nr:MAG: hypothetical protein A2V93_05460 [Ignavibacteria bacterium RBG_16_34_14]